MAKFMKLLTSAYVGGVLRHPHEGVLHVGDEDAERLLKNEAAEDVSDDFPDSADNATTDKVTAADGAVETPAVANQHQAEVAPQAAAPKTKAAAKPAAKKE